MECPVCTLFLRPNVTLESHLATHTKESVIEALAKSASIKRTPIEHSVTQNSVNFKNTTVLNTLKSGQNIAAQSEISFSQWQQFQQPSNGSGQQPTVILPVQQSGLYQNQPMFYQQTIGNVTCATNTNIVMPSNQMLSYHPGQTVIINGQPLLINPNMCPPTRMLPLAIPDSKRQFRTIRPKIDNVENIDRNEYMEVEEVNAMKEDNTGHKIESNVSVPHSGQENGEIDGDSSNNGGDNSNNQNQNKRAECDMKVENVESVTNEMKDDNKYQVEVISAGRCSQNLQNYSTENYDAEMSKRPVITVNLNDSVTLTSNKNAPSTSRGLNVIVTNKKIKAGPKSRTKDLGKNRIIDNVILPEITIIATDTVSRETTSNSNNSQVNDKPKNEDEQTESNVQYGDEEDDIQIVSSESLAPEFTVITRYDQNQSVKKSKIIREIIELDDDERFANSQESTTRVHERKCSPSVSVITNVNEMKRPFVENVELTNVNEINDDKNGFEMNTLRDENARVSNSIMTIQNQKFAYQTDNVEICDKRLNVNIYEQPSTSKVYNTRKSDKDNHKVKPENSLKTEVIILNEEVIELPSQFRAITNANDDRNKSIAKFETPNEVVIEKIETFNGDVHVKNEFNNVYTQGFLAPEEYYPDNFANAKFFDRKPYEEIDIVEYDVKFLLGGSSNVVPNESEENDQERESMNGSPRVLLNLENDMKTDFSVYNSNSVESLSIIRADEKMPSKSELSEQDSLESGSIGPSSSWNREYPQEASSSNGPSYDLMARESWDAASNSSEVLHTTMSSTPRNLSPLHHNVDEYSDIKQPHTFIKSPIYKCSQCPEAFYCPKERRVHQSNVHSNGDIAAMSEGTSRTTQFLSNSAGNIFTTVRSAIKSTAEVLQHPIKEEANDVKPTLPLIKTEILNDEIAMTTQTTAPPSYTEVMLNARIHSDVVTVCTRCNYDFQSISLLRSHHRIDHIDTPLLKFQCVTCSEKFTGENTYNEHLITHPIVCPLCNKSFTTRSSFRSHVRRHTQELSRRFKCDKCPRSFSEQANFDRHQLTHNLTCPVCKETFSDRITFLQHKMQHKLMKAIKKEIKTEVKDVKPNLGRKDYICNTCGEIFQTEKKLHWHEETHETKPKACMHCSEKFVHRASLTRHIRHAHNKQYRYEEPSTKSTISKAPNVECRICHNIYLKSSMSLHLKLHTGLRPFSCNICNKTFTTKWNLKLHKWTHASRTSKPFKCQMCSAGFIRQTDYSSHMNSHKNIKPYTCNICGRKFNRKYNCLRHVKEHKGNKTFRCKVCNKEFHRSYYLRDHMNMHGGIKPYTCHICGKKSSTKSNHNKHVKIHHAREPVSTEG